MVTLDNSNKTLIKGLVRLLRDEIGDGSDGFSESSEYNVPNVWAKNMPDSVLQEFPRGSIDIIAGNDFDLDVELNTRLREVTVKFVVFAKDGSAPEDLTDEIESVVEEKWDTNDSNGNPYLGDWSFRETDGFTELNESGESEGDLRYSRSVDMLFETIRTNK